MIPIIQDICLWNKARYEPVYNKKLTYNLLEEEIKEYTLALDKEDLLEICDGLGDAFYVAVGALWKYGYGVVEITEIIDAVPFIVPPPVALTWVKINDDPRVIGMFAKSVYAQLIIFTTATIALDILRAICKSNNTKEVVKTKPSIKANINKGSLYVSPIKDITNLLNKLGNNNGLQ